MHVPKVNVSTVAIDGGVRAAQRHDSGEKHVSGEAIYVDDLREPPGTLHIYIAMSERAHAVVKRLELERVRAQPGVAIVLTAKDVPGVNDVSPFAGDDPVFADGLVQYHGQSLFAVAADTMAEARGAARLAVVEYEDKSALLTVDEAMQAKSFLEPPCSMERGDARAAIAAAPHMLEGRFYVGGQEHFYLEGQVAFAVPGEDEEVTLHCSSQHPSEIQHKVARVLGAPNHAVTVEVRRMGGGFGGKESQGNLPAAVAALVAKLTGRPAKCCYDRDDDMMITGKRHDFRIDYRVGFDGEGRILGIEFEQAARCGMSIDLSLAIADRAMFHADNAYYLPAVRITSYRCKTHTQSNTAFRGFGGPQGMAAMEHVIEEIAHVLACDPLDVRRSNFYDPMGARPVAPRNLTPYSQTVEDCVIEEIVEELEASSEYRRRRREIREWNALSPVLKRGIALTPVKFGISFTNTMMNQAGALVHVYADGSIALNHGGTEMGQGLNTKVAQVVAEEFQVDIARIKITATQTGKVPNTSATAASSGSDLNGMAARGAAQTIKGRLAAFLAERYQAHASDVLFRPNRIRIKDHELSFDEAVGEAYRARVHLSATGFYATPKIHWDRASGRGRPFFYFAYGAAVSEVAIDTLTGEMRVLRADLLHDVGASINPGIDMGQVEGAFIQGMGWLTTEELVFDAEGRLTTHAPATYKIPVASDTPPIFNTRLFTRPNPTPSIYRSKAVGEPPLMHGISVYSAILDAVHATNPVGQPKLDPPCTPESILKAIASLGRAD